MVFVQNIIIHACVILRLGHAFSTVGQQIYLFGGCSADGVYYSDVHMLDTGELFPSSLDIYLND